jgi:hypothetical protein
MSKSKKDRIIKYDYYKTDSEFMQTSLSVEVLQDKEIVTYYMSKEKYKNHLIKLRYEQSKKNH